MKSNLILLKNKTLIALFCIASLLFFTQKEAQAQRTDYRNYAIFMYNFMQYTEWPQGNNGDIIVGVLGRSRITDELNKIVTLRTIMGRKVVIKQIENIRPNDKYHVIYVSPLKSGVLRTVISTLNNQPTLVVAEREGLAQRGASISFLVLQNNKLSFEINTNALYKHKLRMSSRLLRLGKVVE
ncbi:MAG: YfiR family protein [Bernardetiaceae bacterium]|nr:YfiR family protein [Bernardetiaceae bacterium]